MLGNIKFYFLAEKNPIYFLSLLNFFCYLVYLIHVHKILKGKRWYSVVQFLCCLKFKYDLGIFRRIHNKYDIPLMEEKSLKTTSIFFFIFFIIFIKGSQNLCKDYNLDLFYFLTYTIYFYNLIFLCTSFPSFPSGNKFLQ